jgi:hypothetical protein
MPPGLELATLMYVAVMGVGFPWVLRRGEAARKPVTPRRVVAVALLTPAAGFMAFVEGAYAQPVVDSAVGIAGSGTGHVLFHFAWVVLALPIAFALQRFRSNWPASGWTERCLAAAQMLVLVVVAGNVLAAIGAAIGRGSEWRLDYVLANIFHAVGEVLAVGSDLVLIAVCLVMLGVGVRGALRPATACDPLP